MANDYCFSNRSILRIFIILSITVVAGALTEEHQFQSKLVRTQNTEEESSPNPWSSLIAVIFILFATILQSKAAMLWSESRILRKINDRTHSTLTDGITTTDTNIRFATIFKNLSKGRHRRFSRMFSHFFLFFGVGLDLMFSLEHFRNVSVIPTSEALTTVRALIYFGSFTVLGVRPLSRLETLGLCLVVLVQASSLSLFGLGKIQIPNTGRTVIHVLRVLVLLTFLFIESMRSWSTFHSTGNDVSQIVNVILKNNLRDGSKQAKRLERMHAIAKSEENMGNSWNEKPYTRPKLSQFFEWGSIMLFALMNGPAFGEEDFHTLPNIVIIESLEIVSNFLLFINDTQVEPELFVRLLRIARIEDEMEMV